MPKEENVLAEAIQSLRYRWRHHKGQEIPVTISYQSIRNRREKKETTTPPGCSDGTAPLFVRAREKRRQECARIFGRHWWEFREGINEEAFGHTGAGTKLGMGREGRRWPVVEDEENKFSEINLPYDKIRQYF